MTVTAARDEDAVADPAITLTHTAAGGGYDSIETGLTVTISETDMRRVTVSPTVLNIAEGNFRGLHGGPGTQSPRAT